jgi:hypothetical protein
MVKKESEVRSHKPGGIPAKLSGAIPQPTCLDSHRNAMPSMHSSESQQGVEKSLHGAVAAISYRHKSSGFKLAMAT